MTDTTPFKRRIFRAPVPTRVLCRFEKGKSWAEIRERKVVSFEGLEFLVFMDGSLLESQMFHSRRLPEYPTALAERIKQFTEGGWTETACADLKA